MSGTEIFRGKAGEQPEEIAYISNSFRGAMCVWNNVAQKYHNMDMFPMFDESARKQVWNTCDTHDMPKHERIVLLSTFDGACVDNKDLPELIAAFKAYHKEYEHSSLGEQANVIESLETPLDDFEFIFWNQTSVNCDYSFCEYKEVEDEDGEIEYIQTVKLSKCFDIFGDIR